MFALYCYIWYRRYYLFMFKLINHFGGGMILHFTYFSDHHIAFIYFPEMLCWSIQPNEINTPINHHLNLPLPSLQMLSLTLLTLLSLSLLPFSSPCDFPTRVHTNSTTRSTGSPRDWRGRVKDQFVEFTLRIEITRNVIRTISTDSTARSHNRACVREVPGGKYMVAHEESGQQGNRY